MCFINSLTAEFWKLFGNKIEFVFQILGLPKDELSWLIKQWAFNSFADQVKGAAFAATVS